jgi:hypothetical protein
VRPDIRRRHHRRETIRLAGAMFHPAGWTTGRTRHSHDQASRANVI